MAEQRAMTFAEIAALARRVGFPTSVANTMAAVALAESGGRFWAVGDNFRVEGATRNPKARYDLGLFQINSMHGYDRDRLTSDPEYNAKAAFDIYQRQGLNAWTTFKRGTHKQFLSGNSGSVTDGEPASTGSPEPDAPPAKKTTKELREYIADKYPVFFGLLKTDKQVRDILLRAAQEEWTDGKLQAELFNTAWWKKTAETRRVWDARYGTNGTDPATGQQMLRNQERDIQAAAARMGVPLSADQARLLATNVLRNGWTPLMVQESLGRLFRMKSAKPGTGTATVDALRAMAAQYAVRISSPTLAQWTRDILGGRTDENGFRSYLAAQAKRLFPEIADEIDEGRSVREYFDPYAEAAVDLGVVANAAEFDLADERWRRAIFDVDPKGKRVIRNLDQWERELKTDPRYGYDRTPRGVREATDLASGLARAMGAPV